MRCFFILGLFFSFFLVASPTDKKDKLENLYLEGMDSFSKNICVETKDSSKQGAISYFEEYISLGGDKDKVLKYLGYCKILVGQTDFQDKESLKDGVEYLSEVFEKDNSNINLLKLIILVYVKLEDYEKAKTYAILLDNKNQKDNDLFLLISRLYFNTEEYDKVINYLKSYFIYEKDENEDEVYFMKAYSYFKLKNYAKSKKYFNKLLAKKELSSELKDFSINTLKIIESRENFSKYPSFYSLDLVNGIVFDSNVYSANLIKNNGKSKKAYGVRDENYISVNLYPLNLNDHAIILQFNNFISAHFPKIIDDFDPNDYDIISLSGLLAYEFHRYFTPKNVFKVLIYGGYEVFWSNAFKDTSLHSQNGLFGFHVFYKLENEMSFGIYSDLSFENYEYNVINPSENSETGNYFRFIGFTSIPNVPVFNLKIYGGYIGSRTNGKLFTYDGFLAMGEINFSIFENLFLNASIQYQRKGYYERTDDLMILGGNIEYYFNDYIGLNLRYHYYKNNSSLKDFYYDKHLAGLYFNFSM